MFYVHQSKKEGYGPLASKVPRFLCRTQTFTDRLFHPLDNMKPIKKNWQPFGKCMKERKVFSAVPGYNFYNLKTFHFLIIIYHFSPGTYTVKNRTRKYIFRDSFGGHKIVIPAVHTICSPNNYAICNGCEEYPIGDYWQQKLKDKIYCRSCMKIEHNKAVDVLNPKPLKQKKLAELSLFKVISL